jgi:hypothetical protein
MGERSRIGLDTLAGGRYNQPRQDKPIPVENEPSQQEEAKLEGTRWLYDSEDDYKRAQKKLAAEIALEKKKKELAKKVRVDRAKRLAGSAAGKLKPALSTALTRTAKFLRAALVRTNRKKLLIGAGALGALLLIFAFSSQSGFKKPSSQVLGGQPASPTFDTLVPNDDAKLTTSGNVAFNKEKQVASFTDTIDEVPITVSQQALPERFQKNPKDELAKFAEDLNAREKIEVGNVTAYSGVSEKGPQTIVLIKNQVLLFITADKKLPQAQLIGYIDSLK